MLLLLVVFAYLLELFFFFVLTSDLGDVLGVPRGVTSGVGIGDGKAEDGKADDDDDEVVVVVVVVVVDGDDGDVFV